MYLLAPGWAGMWVPQTRNHHLVPQKLTHGGSPYWAEAETDKERLVRVSFCPLQLCHSLCAWASLAGVLNEEGLPWYKSSCPQSCRSPGCVSHREADPLVLVPAGSAFQRFLPRDQGHLIPGSQGASFHLLQKQHQEGIPARLC